VLAIGILLGGILPLVDKAVSWDNPIVAGDRLDLGGGITVTPPIGWQLESGFLVGGPSPGVLRARSELSRVRDS
jgi:hypothetical protein